MTREVRFPVRSLLFVALALAVPAASAVGSLAHAPTTSKIGPAVEWATPVHNKVVTICGGPFGSCNNNSTSGGPALSYSGGPVLIKPKAFLTYWDWNTPVSDPDGAAPYLENFFRGVGGSGWANVQTQYTNAAGQHITNPTDQFGGSWYDTNTALPPIADVETTSVYVEQEVSRAVAHFGYDADAVYFVLMPHGYPVDFAGGYCAYHSAFHDALNRSIAYSTLPYVSDFPTVAVPADNPLLGTDAVAGCGVNFIKNSPHPNLDAFSMTAGHEYEEAVTDKEPPSGWYSSSGGENGDMCQFVFTGPGSYQELTLSTGVFGVQGLWSNADHDCAVNYP